MPGTVLQVHTKSGDLVKAGQAVISVGAMKMEYVVTATVDGRVGQVLVRAGDSVALDQVVEVVEPAALPDSGSRADPVLRGERP
jgi:acetyl-CoA/propionyl-CoA carboxylase biotin carboxyl carrier protein